jgi:dynein heavy chain
LTIIIIIIKAKKPEIGLLFPETAQLNEKQSQLKAVLDKVALLQKTCDDTLAEKNRLQQESDTTAKRLVRAEKLTNGLNSEGERWRQNIVTLGQ